MLHMGVGVGGADGSMKAVVILSSSEDSVSFTRNSLLAERGQHPQYPGHHVELRVISLLILGLREAIGLILVTKIFTPMYSSELRYYSR